MRVTQKDCKRTVEEEGVESGKAWSEIKEAGQQ
jgi:hypothetical protein